MKRNKEQKKQNKEKHSDILKCVCAGSVWSEWVVPASGPAQVLSGAEAGGAPRGSSKSLPHQGGVSAGLLLGLQLPAQHPLRPQPIQHPEQTVSTHR